MPLELETHLAGRPEDIHDVARFLTSILSPGMARLADEAAVQRRVLRAGWQGRDGDAFCDAAAELCRAGDGMAALAREMGEQVDALGSALALAQDRMAGLRERAPRLGLTLDGTRIESPVLDLANGAGGRLDELAGNFAQVRSAHESILDDWFTALSETERLIRANSGSVMGLTTSFVVAGYRGVLMNRHRSVMRGQVVELERRMKLASVRMEDLVRRMRATGYVGGYDEVDLLFAERQGNERAVAAAQAQVDNPRLPKGLDRSLRMLGPLATGYAMYDDVHTEGESVEQAVVSQGGGAVIGLVFGAAITGAALGSGLPVLGTVAGGVIGGVAAVRGDALIDSRYRGSGRHEATGGSTAQPRPEPHPREHAVIRMDERIRSGAGIP